MRRPTWRLPGAAACVVRAGQRRCLGRQPVCFGHGATERAGDPGAQLPQPLGHRPDHGPREIVRAFSRIGLGRSRRGGGAVGFARDFVRAVLVGRRLGGLGRGQDQPGLLGLAVGRKARWARWVAMPAAVM